MKNRDLDLVFVDFKIRRQDGVVQLRDFRDLRGAFRVDGDDLASLQAVAGAVDNLAVNQDVAMRHDLAGGENRAGEAGTIDDGHQTHFQIAEELVTRDAFAALRVLIDEAELMLGQVVERPQLLLFEKQFAVGGELAAAFGRAMLTGRIVTRLSGGSAALSTVTGGSLNAENLVLSGVLFGIGAGVCYGMVAILGRVTTAKVNPFVAITWTFFFGSIFILLFVRPWNEAVFPTNAGFVTVGLLFALIPTTFSYLFYFSGVSVIKETSKVPVIASIEPVVATLIGVIAYHEPIGVINVLGILLVIGSIVMMNQKQLD